MVEEKLVIGTVGCIKGIGVDFVAIDDVALRGDAAYKIDFEPGRFGIVNDDPDISKLKVEDRIFVKGALVKDATAIKPYEILVEVKTSVSAVYIPLKKFVRG